MVTTLDDIMRAFEKIRELVILDWYFSGRMETLVVDYVGGSFLLLNSSGCLYGVFEHLSQPVLLVLVLRC